jgi:hypothetical protein
MISLRKKALVLIEAIALFDEREDPEMINIYRIAHAANGQCLNEHEDWKKIIEDGYADLVARGEHREESPARHKKRLQKLSDKMEHMAERHFVKADK